MIDAPEIVLLATQEAAVIPFRIPRAQIREVMGPGIQELRATLAAQGLAPAGPVFSHHFRLDPEVFDFEVGIPVVRPVKAQGRVRPGRLPAATVARTTFRGPYEGLGPAWGAFDAWLAAEGHQAAQDLWECYRLGPESDPDPAAWETDLVRPLVR